MTSRYGTSSPATGRMLPNSLKGSRLSHLKNWMPRRFTKWLLMLAVTLSPFFAVSTAGAQYTLKTLVTFNNANGENPYSTLIADAQGNLYGTTESGGTNDQGTVFEVEAGTHTLTTLVSFSGTDGSQPLAGLVADGSGNLYGTTYAGGAQNRGTVFQLAAGTRTLSTLFSFSGLDGSRPRAALTTDANGNLYGTTLYGGASSLGTVFKLAAGTHAFTSLASFDGTNGDNPIAGVIADASGNLFGTAWQDGPGGKGTVFKVAAGTHALSTLVAFNKTNGSQPQANLIMDASGNMYSTTAYGGANNVWGTVFKVAAGTNALSTLATFNGTNGGNPFSPLILDASGNLYGMTYPGGNLAGTIFKVTADTHTLSTIYQFNFTDGAAPNGGLLADASGNFYGTTVAGGAFGYGTVFELSPVPEPSSVALISIGLVSAVVMRRRQPSSEA